MLDDLRRLGVQPGHSLMVHASMRAVGGRAEVLIDALQTAVAPDGSLLLLICADPETPFDPQTSPAWSELGVLCEVFRTTEGVRVNDHPIARFGSWGTQADRLILDPPLHDYYGPGSPLERLHDAGGRVLRLGADEDTTTLLHYAEYLVNLQPKRRVQHQVVVATPNGPEQRTVRCLDDSEGIGDWSDPLGQIDDYFAAILAAARTEGLGARGQVGGATAELFEARPLVRYAVSWMEANLRPVPPPPEASA